MGAQDESSKHEVAPAEPPPPYSPSPDILVGQSSWSQPAGPSTVRPQLSARPSSGSLGGPQLTPTEVPTPGRPLLRDGKFLVYKPGVFCHKCELRCNHEITGAEVRNPRWQHGIQGRRSIPSLQIRQSSDAEARLDPNVPLVLAQILPAIHLSHRPLMANTRPAA